MSFFARVLCTVKRFAIPAFGLLLLAVPSFGQAVTVSGNVKTLTGVAVSTSSFVRFRLRNYTGSVPRVLGTGALLPSSAGCGVCVDIKPDVNGNIVGSIYGDDQITPPNTFYTVEFWWSGRIIFSADFLIAGSAFNLNSATPVSSPATTPITPTQISRSFTFIQSPAATTWTMAHNFGTLNVIGDCFDSSSQRIFPDTFKNTDANTTVVTFVIAQAGSCTLFNTTNFSLISGVSSVVVTNPTAGQSITGGFPLTLVGGFTANTVTDSGLTVGNCVQAGTGGLLTTVSFGCNPGGVTTTGSPLSGQGAFWSGAASVTGSPNWTYSASTGHSFTQGANGNETLFASRFTDTSPTGNFLHFQNAAKNADLFALDVITGRITTENSLAPTGTGALVRGTSPTLNTPTISGFTVSGTILGSAAWSGSQNFNGSVAFSAQTTFNNNIALAANFSFFCNEGTAPSGSGSKDFLWCDSSTHRWNMNNNNGGAVTVGTTLVYSAAGTEQVGTPHIVQDTATLAAGTVTVTLSGSAAFTNATSYTCIADDDTAIAATKVIQNSGSSVTINGTGTDVVRFICVGN